MAVAHIGHGWQLLGRTLRGMSVDPLAARAPLVRRARTCVAAVIVLAAIVPYLSSASLSKHGRAGPMADLTPLVVPAVLTAWLAPYASYRRRDALLWLVGVGGLVFVVIAWRVAFAPYRDWRPRPEECPGCTG